MSIYTGDEITKLMFDIITKSRGEKNRMKEQLGVKEEKIREF